MPEVANSQGDKVAGVSQPAVSAGPSQHEPSVTAIAAFYYIKLFYHSSLTVPRPVVAWAVQASGVCFCLVGSKVISHHLRTGVLGSMNPYVRWEV